MRMSHGRYPCSEQTHQSPTNAPQTEQQERDHQTPSRQGRTVHHKVARIAGDEAHQEGNQVEDGSCKSACQEAEPSTDGYSANDQTDKKPMSRLSVTLRSSHTARARAVLTVNRSTAICWPA